MALDAPRTLELAVHGPIARSDLPGLSARLCARLSAAEADLVLCDVRGVEPDAVTIDALARLHLAAQRHRCAVRLRNVSPALLDLVAFVGLADVLGGRG
ncbi:MAG: STAS domain-containing protein [Gaiella sp.]|nr:STAS domain-containing protein [Gaiella sp.]